jgi:hypothetical protein
MEKEFVPYEIALELNRLGFDEPCFKGYTEEYKTLINFSNNHTNTSVKNTLPTKPFTAPLYQQAFRWFREKHNLFGCIDLHTSTPIHWYIRIDDIIKNDYIYHSEDNDLKFKTYEEAELECLKKLIEIAKSYEN